MAKTDIRVDHYIDEATPFAQPVLEHLRWLIHRTCPDVREAIKWKLLFFEYAGGNLCHMGAFKKHCAFGFWLESKMDDPEHILSRGKNKVKDSPLARITSVKDLPSDKVLKQYIKQAMALLDQGVKLARPKPAAAGASKLAVPAYLTAALRENPSAKTYFDSFSPSARKDYILWLTDAKTEATRTKRLQTALIWMAEGKTRHWKYK